MNAKAKLIGKIGAVAAAAAVAFVAGKEGTVPRTYLDPIGIITACTGHVDPSLKLGTSYTAEQCQDMLYADLTKHADDLDCVKAPLTDNQKVALLSFTFNVGRGSFCGSTLVRKANAGDMPGACAELSRWVMAGGRQLPGLVNRRAAERALCETP
jgi:lysozyme